MIKLVALVLAVVLAPGWAAAEPGQSIGWLCATFPKLSRCPKPQPSPTVPISAPAPQTKAKPETKSTVAPESPATSAKNAQVRKSKQADRSKSAGRSQTGRSSRNRQVDQKSAVVPPPSGGGQRLPLQEPSATGFTCAEARQGVGLPCFIIRQHAYRYERLSSVDKARADACLTASERASIKACFK